MRGAGRAFLDESGPPNSELNATFGRVVTRFAVKGCLHVNEEHTKTPPELLLRDNKRVANNQPLVPTASREVQTLSKNREVCRSPPYLLNARKSSSFKAASRTLFVLNSSFSTSHLSRGEIAHATMSSFWPVPLPPPAPPPPEKPRKHDKRKSPAYQLTIEPPWMRDEMPDPDVLECEIHTPKPDLFAVQGVRPLVYAEEPATKAAVIESKEDTGKSILKEEPRVDRLLEMVVDNKLLKLEGSSVPVVEARAQVAKAQKDVWFIKEQIIEAKEELKSDRERYNLILEDLKTAWIAIDKIHNAINTVFPRQITIATQTKDEGVNKHFPYLEWAT